MSNIIKNCKTCKHYVFDETWGEHKCKKFAHRICDLDKYVDCQSYEKKKEEKK